MADLNSNVWTARECELYVADAASVGASSTLYDSLSTPTTFSGSAKSITISPPEGAIEKVDLFGEDTNGFQNQKLEEKPWGLATITGTILHESAHNSTSDELFETWMDTGEEASSGYYRYRLGDGGRTQCAILVKLSDGSQEVQILLNNAYFTKLGDRKISGGDSHWEQDFEAKCLVRHYYVDYKEE